MSRTDGLRRLSIERALLSRPQGILLPAEAIKEENEAEKPFLKLHDLEMQESSQSNVTMNSKVALRFQGKSQNSSYSQTRKPIELTDHSKSNMSGGGQQEHAEAFCRPNDRLDSPGQRLRGSVYKKNRHQESKKKKYRDLLDECAHTRYALYYADDVVQHGLRTKTEVHHRLLADKMDGKFEKHLREQEGIFFAINVRPTSPRKRHHGDSVLRPFSRDPNKGKSDNSVSEQSSAMKNFGPSFYVDENEIYRQQSSFGRSYLQQAQMQESPTFKQSIHREKDSKQQFFTGESPNSSPKRNSSPEMNQKRQQPPSSGKQMDMAEQMLRSRRSLDHLELSAQDSLVDLDEMLLSNQNSSRQQAPEDQLRSKATIQPQDREDQAPPDILEITVKKNGQDPWVQEVKATLTSAQTKPIDEDKQPLVEQQAVRRSTGSSQTDDGDKMRKLSSFLNTNYDSPNLMDIMKERRLHEIEEIDRRVSSKHHNRGKFQACTGTEADKGRANNEAESSKGHPDGEQAAEDVTLAGRKRQEVQCHDDASEAAEAGQKGSKNEMDRVVNSRNGAEGDIEALSFPMAYMVREVSFKKADKYNNKFIQTQSTPNANEGRNRAAKSDCETAHQQFDGHGNVPMQRSDTKRMAAGKLFAEEMRNVPPEPKSSLLREDRKIGRCSTVLIDQGGAFKQQERSTFRNLKNSQDLSENCSNVSAGSTSSQQSSNKVFHANIQLYKMKSIMTNKVSVGGRKLDRQAELRNRNEELSLCKDSVLDSQQQRDSNNEPYNINKDLGHLSSQRQYSQNIVNFNYLNALTNKNPSPCKKPRASALNIKKNETVEPYLNSLALDSNGQSSNMQKTSVRKDSVSKSKKTGDRSLLAQTSSNKDPQFPHSKQSTRPGNALLRRQRRKEMRQLRKFLKDWPVFPSKEEREEEEIVQKQVRGLNKLKALCERLKGQPITTNCYNGGDNAGDDNDLSNNDATTNGAADQYNMVNLNVDGAQLGHYLHSHGSKDPSVSVSTPNNAYQRSSNNQTKEHQTAHKASSNELGHYLRQIEADNVQVGRSTMLSVSKSEYHIQEDGGQGIEQTMNDTVKRKKKTMDQGSSFSKQEDYLDYRRANEREDGLVNREQERARASARRQEFRRQRQETVSISGYNEDHKFSLNVRDVDFSHISNDKSNDVSNKSIGSVDEGAIAQSMDARKKGTSKHLNEQPFSKSRSRSPLGAETTSSRQTGHLQPQTSHKDLSRSRDGNSERSDLMRKGLAALDRRVFDHRDTFGQPFQDKPSTTKLTQSQMHLRRPSKLSQDYQGADTMEEGAPESELFLNQRDDATEALGAQTNGYESFVSIQDRDKLLSVPEASQSTMSRPNQNANNLNIFEPARQGDESSLSVPFSPYLPSGDVNSSEQQSLSPSVFEQSQLAWKNSTQKPLISEMQSPIHLISDGARQDEPLGLVCQQRSSNLDRGPSQESLGLVAQRQGHGSGRPRPAPSQSHKPFGLKIYELDMEVEQSRRANEEMAPSNVTEQNASSPPPLQNEGSERIMDVNLSPQFQGGDDQADRAALTGSSLQKNHPQTSPINSGASPLVDDSVLEQQLVNFKPIMKKNAQSHHISPSDKRRLNVNINEAAQVPAYIYKNLNQTSTHKRFQTGKNILKGPHVEAGGFATNLDLLLSRNSRNERLSSNQMQGLSSIISGSESEFSFKKNPAFFSKERNDKFEMSLNKMEGYSFKKIDSPANFANEAYGSQHSISKASKTSLNQASSLGKECANSSNFMNDSKSSNQSKEKKIQNQAQNTNKSGISFNLMRCLKDIDRDIEQKIVGQQRTLAPQEIAEHALEKSEVRSAGEQARVSGTRGGHHKEEERSIQAESVAKGNTDRAQAERAEQKRAGAEQRPPEKKSSSKLAYTEASCPQWKEFDSSQPSEQSPTGARQHQKRANTTSSAVKGASAATKYEQAYVQNLLMQQNLKEGKHAKGIPSEAERDTRLLRPTNSKSQLSHLSEAEIAGKEQRSQSQTKARRPLNEYADQIQRVQTQISRTSKSNEALLTEQKTAIQKQYGALESSQIEVEAPPHSVIFSKARQIKISQQDAGQNCPNIGASDKDGLEEKGKAAPFLRLTATNAQERGKSSAHQQAVNPKQHFANRQSVIPNLNKQFSDVPNNKVVRKKSEQNRPQGTDAPQMQSQHFQQLRGLDQSSISKGSYLDQQASKLSQQPAKASLNMVQALMSDQSNPSHAQHLASRRMMIDDDLNELQSILDRHHKRTTKKERRKKTKQRDRLAGHGADGARTGIDAITDFDVGLQSIYDDTYSQFGVTSYGKYHKRLDDYLEIPSNSRAPEGGVRSPKYTLFHQNNNVRLSQHYQQEESTFLQGHQIRIINVEDPKGRADQGMRTAQNTHNNLKMNFYNIEDDGVDKQSIFNRSESHLGDEPGEQQAKYPRAQPQFRRQLTGQERTQLNQSPEVMSQKSAADPSPVVQMQHSVLSKAANPDAPSRQKQFPPSTLQQPQVLHLDQQQQSQYSSQYQSRRLGYSNYFQQKYVDPARQRSNSRNAARRKSATATTGTAQSTTATRPLLISEQVSAKGLAQQLPGQDTFSRDPSSYLHANDWKQSTLQNGNLTATLSLQPSLKQRAEYLGQQSHQTSGKLWQPGPNAPLNMMTFTRMTSIADMARHAEDPRSQWQDAQNISEFLQSFNQQYDETQSMVLTPQTFSNARGEARSPLGAQTRPGTIYNNTPFQLQPGGVVDDQEQAMPFGTNFAPEGRSSMRRSGKFGRSDSTGKAASRGASCNFESTPGNQNANGSYAGGNFLGNTGAGVGEDPHGAYSRNGQGNGNRATQHEESRRSGGARGQLRENILQQMKEPRMPVYYENHEGPRFSILSEMIQAQPYRPDGTIKSQKRTYQENINQQSTGRHQAADPDNPFTPLDSGSPTLQGASARDSLVNSGKTGNFLKQSTLGPGIAHWHDRESNPARYPPRNWPKPEHEDGNTHASPFDLDLRNHMDSEPTHASYLQQRQQLMKKF